MLLVALVFAELGMAKPESRRAGALPDVRHGGLAAGIVGWAIWISYVGNPPTEAAGVVQYAASYLPGVYDDEQLTGPGVGVAVVLMAGLRGAQLVRRAALRPLQHDVTAIKIVIPVADGGAAARLAGSTRRTSPTHGGFAPYG